MKKIMIKAKASLAAILAILLLCAMLPLGGVAVGAASDDVVFFEDFESTTAGTTGAWTNGQKATAVVKEGVGKDFSKGMIVNGPKWSRVTQYFTLEANTQYEISFDYYESTDTKTTQLLIRDANTTYDIYASGSLGNTKGMWEHYSAVFFSEDLTSVRVMLMMDDEIQNSDKTFDNIKISKVKASVFEEDFESTEAGTAGAWTNGQKATSVVKAGVGKDFTKGMVVNGPKWSRTYQTIELEANTSYEISFDYYESTDTNTVQIVVRDANTSYDIYMSDALGNTKGAWEHYTGTFFTEDLTKVRLMLMMNDEVTNSDKVFDNIVIRKAVAEPEQLVFTNGDFETGDFTGWQGQVKSSIVTENVHSGSYALKVTEEKWGGVSQMVSVTPNTDYKLTFWARHEAGSGEQTLFVMDSKKQTNLQTERYRCSAGEGWKKFEFIINSCDQYKISLKFGISNPNVTFVYDDISFAPLGAVSYDGYLYNGDFESGNLAKWEGGTSFEVTTEAYEGEYAVHVKGEQYANMHQVVPTKANTDYSVVLWAKKASGNGKFALIYKDAITSQHVTEMYFDATDEWQKFVWTFNTKESANGEFFIMCSMPEDTVYIDSVSMVEGLPISINGLIYNGDFETGDLAKWDNVYSDSVVVDTDKNDGAYALHLKGGQWSAIRQTVKTVKNTEYMISFYVKRVAGADNMAVWLKNGDSNLLDPDGKEIGLNYNVTEADGWLKVEHIFNSFDQTSVDILFGITEAGNEVLIDGIYVKKYVKPQVLPLPLTSISVTTNRPIAQEDNLIVNSGFESAEGAQWNTYTFLGEYVSVVEDENAFEGDKCLYFNSKSTEKTKYVFWVNVEPHTDYTFSAFVKGAYLSAENACRATFGVVDPDTETFLIYAEERGKNSKADYQLVPPCWDNDWHLRSLTFNSGDKTSVGIAVYGSASQMYLDSLALYKSDRGEQYTVPQNSDVISTNINAQYAGCAPEDNLVGNSNFEDEQDTFWSTGYGWKNSFVSLYESEFGYGNALQYVGSDTAAGVRYIKWIDVKPNTDYTFSANFLVQESGAGMLEILDSRLSTPMDFIKVEFDQSLYGDEWNQFFLRFNTGVYERIGIAILDKGGKALIDNVRIFETSKGKDVADEYIEERNGWINEDGKWAYYVENVKVTNKWVTDSKGWCYLGEDGYCVTNKWVADSYGWCYLDENGRMVTNKWVMDSKGWCYVGEYGYCLTSMWVKDSVGWCYVDADGRMVTDKWIADSHGWCYLGSDGRMVTNAWVKDSKGWCYLGDDGYCVTNQWVADSHGWCYLDENGRMVTNAWVKDSKGWCYIGKDGYCLTNTWVADSKGWCYLDANGRMVYSQWVTDGGKKYYINASGYMVTGTHTINGKKYTFNASGVCVS